VSCCVLGDRANVENDRFAGCRSTKELVTTDLLRVVITDVATPRNVNVGEVRRCDLAHLDVERCHVRLRQSVSNRGALPACCDQAGLLERLQVR
jgi:hypothetical protein